MRFFSETVTPDLEETSSGRDGHATGDQIFAPCFVEVAAVGEDDRRRQVGGDADGSGGYRMPQIGEVQRRSSMMAGTLDV